MKYITIGTQVIWLVKECYDGNSSYISFKYRNDVVDEIKIAIDEEVEILKEEIENINELLPII